MAIYTKITKVSERNNKHVYEICNDSDSVDCYTVLDGTRQVIKIYKDAQLKKLIFELDLRKSQDAYKPFGSYGYLFARGLQKLIPAIKKGVFPQCLDKCS